MPKTKNQSKAVESVYSDLDFTKRILVGIPMTGLLRAEWHLAYMAQVIPCNWSQGIFAWIYNQYTPIRFLVADARNIIVKKAIEQNFEWLFFIDHDVILPSDVFIKWNNRILKGDVPIFGGLYFTKSVPAEPLLYRGRGNSFFDKWKLGKEVWVDGMGLGCHAIHCSILKVMYEESEEYTIEAGPNKTITLRKVFETPSGNFYDPEGRGMKMFKGTEDLPWYSRIMKEDIFKKAGWSKFQRKKYPFLCDTSVFCKHIDFDGKQYPLYGEEKEYK
jgi:hypothetical protein